MTTNESISSTQEAIAGVLRAELARNNVTQVAISQATGIGTTVLNRYFMGAREVPSTTLFLILEAAQIDPTHFWNEVQRVRGKASGEALES